MRTVCCSSRLPRGWGVSATGISTQGVSAPGGRHAQWGVCINKNHLQILFHIVPLTIIMLSNLIEAKMRLNLSKALKMICKRGPSFGVKLGLIPIFFGVFCSTGSFRFN